MNPTRLFHAALVTTILVGGSALAGETEKSTSCYSIGGGKTNCYVYQQAWTTNDPVNGDEVGILNSGWQYFYCQKAFPTEGVEWHGHRSYWYLKTDDDRHNRNVWFNAVFVSSGSDNSPIPGVPHC